MGSQSLSFNAMVTQVLWSFKNKSVENYHFLLKSVHRVVVKVKALLKDFSQDSILSSEVNKDRTCRPLGNSLRSGWWFTFFLGLFKRLHIRSTATSSGQMARHHMRRCFANLRSHPLFTGERDLAHIQSQPPTQNCRSVLRLKNHLLCG